jgi:hypothetical protein
MLIARSLVARERPVAGREALVERGDRLQILRV